MLALRSAVSVRLRWDAKGVCAKSAPHPAFGHLLPAAPSGDLEATAVTADVKAGNTYTLTIDRVVP